MPTLEEDYIMAEFNQGKVLKSDDFKFKKDVQGGVCAALCNCWILMILDGKDILDITVLTKEFNLAIGKQRIWRDAFSETSGDHTTKYNAVSYVTRMRFTNAGGGQFVDPFAATVKGLPDDVPYFLRIDFSNDKGAHALGLSKIAGNGLVVFDPNLGILCAYGKMIGPFSKLLWARYASWGLNIAEWQIWEITKAESARERMQKALAKLS